MTNQPSDYLCEDGDMLEAVYAEWRDGSYHAARIPKGMTFHVEGFRPRFLHEPSDGKKYYIGVKRNEEDTKWVLAAYTDDGSEVTVENAPSSESDEAFGNFCALGNVVCLTVSGIICTITCKNSSYHNVAITRQPLEMRFGAKLEDYNEIQDGEGGYDGYRYIGGKKDVPNLGSNLPANVPYEYRFNEFYCPSKFTDGNAKADDYIFGAFNSLVSDLKAQCRFIFPVLLKYAIKLYSGEYINVSPPILLFPYPDNTYLFGKASGLTIEYDSWSIYYSFTDAAIEQINEFKKLDNFVESIDVFVTPQIYDIRTDHAVYNSFAITAERCISFIKKMGVFESYKHSDYYLVKSIHLSDFNAEGINNYYNGGKWFYPLLSVNGEDEGKLATLEEQETLKAGSYSNSSMYAESVMTFNSRLVASNLTKVNPELWSMDILCPPILGYLTDGHASEVDLEQCKLTFENIKFTRDNTYLKAKESTVYAVTVNTNSSSITECSNGRKTDYIPLYFEYPVSGYGYLSFNIDRAFKIPLKNSDFNNGSYYCCPSKVALQELYLSTTDDVPTSSIGNIKFGKLVKMSNVNDPFTFKDGNSCECGRGSVIAIATSATPTSQGQFGQYPLFAFCTDGVYAIGIGTDGTIQNCSPFSTDIISGPDALVNVGRDIVFATRNGVFSIGENGRTMLMQVDNLDCHTFPNEIGNNRFNEWFDSTLTDHSIIHPSWVPLNVFMESAKMAYDYQHNRIILYNPGVNYCYLMDAASKRWSVLPNTFSNNLNPVAQCLMVEADKEIVTDYSTDIVLPSHSAYWVTRPFKLGDLNAFKTIRSIIQRGVFKDASKVQQALFGSNDLQHWVPVKSSKSPKLRNLMGSGYKYFRLAVFFKDMEQGENIAGASIGFDVRMNNKIR